MVFGTAAPALVFKVALTEYVEVDEMEVEGVPAESRISSVSFGAVLVVVPPPEDPELPPPELVPALPPPPPQAVSTAASNIIATYFK